uniref:RRM domain-containing protein n=1 Tax=Eutreptiella gymnastica TaxID=73025 RepID=A0A7S4GBP7_9EUGL
MTTQMGPRNQTIPQPDKPFFDYAVQYITATDPWFCEEVGRWTALGLCQPLPPGEVGVASAAGGYRPLPQDVPCYVGNGGMWRLMSALTEQAAEQYAGALEHVSGFPDDRRAVVGLARRGQDGGWDLQLKGGQWLGPFDYVVGGFAQHCLTEPFLRRGGAACDKMLRCLRHIKYSQLFPVQVVFDGVPAPAGFTAAHIRGEHALSFACNNSKKPRANGAWGTAGAQHWTLMSTAAFAEAEFSGGGKGKGKGKGEGKGESQRVREPQTKTYGIYVAKLPENTEDSELKSEFGQFGTIVDVRNRPVKKIAFIDFSTEDAQQKAIQAAENKELVIRSQAVVVQKKDGNLSAGKGDESPSGKGGKGKGGRGKGKGDGDYSFGTAEGEKEAAGGKGSGKGKGKGKGRGRGTSEWSTAKA